MLAERQLRPGIGTRWGVLGHSQGGHAALFTVSLASTWAPDLNLIGAVALAPAQVAGLRCLDHPGSGDQHLLAGCRVR